MTETNTLSNSVDKKEYPINHSFHCNDKCIIYLLTCNKCQLQYVGKTVDDFNYKDNNRKYLGNEACMQQHLFEYYLSEGHSGFLNGVFNIFIDKIDPKDPIKRNTTGDIPLKQCLSRF